MFISNELMMTLNYLRVNKNHCLGFNLNTNFSFVTDKRINDRGVEIFRYRFKVTQEFFNAIEQYQKSTLGVKSYGIEFMDENKDAVMLYKRDYYDNIIVPRSKLLKKLHENHNKIFNIGKDYYKINDGIILTNWNPKADKKKATKKSKIIRVADMDINTVDLFMKAI